MNDTKQRRILHCIYTDTDKKFYTFIKKTAMVKIAAFRSLDLHGTLYPFNILNF